MIRKFILIIAFLVAVSTFAYSRPAAAQWNFNFQFGYNPYPICVWRYQPPQWQYDPWYGWYITEGRWVCIEVAPPPVYHSPYWHPRHHDHWRHHNNHYNNDYDYDDY